MLEYVQRLVCAVGPKTDVPPVSDDEFNRLANATSKLFQLLNADYFHCRSARLAERMDYDVHLDEYAVSTEMIWLGVRGNRYMSHEAEYFRKILAPQSSMLETAYGVNADMVANGVEAIISSLSKGIFTAMADLEDFRDETLAAIEKDPALESMLPGDAMHEVVRRNGWEDRGDSVLGRVFGTELFDVQKITGWPTVFVEDLSLCPGDDIDFAAEGREMAWPTRFSQTHFAPFLRCGNRFYCFDIYGLSDRLYRAVERGLRRRSSSNGERWNRGQKRASEGLTAELFSRLLPGASLFLDAHYWITNPQTGERTWTDCDIVIGYESQLFVVEVKAGRYTHKAPGNHIRDHLDSLRELIESAAVQANRLIDELEGHGELVIYNAKRESAVTLRRNDFDRVNRCCVSLDQIEDIASHAEDLAKLGIDIGPHPVWTVSLNDLLVIADVFKNPLLFIDYLGERLRAFSSPNCRVSDELDHLGLYLQHNRYVMRAEKLAPANAIGWHGYRDAFDRYYSELWQGHQATLPVQEMPRWMEQVLDLIVQSRSPGRVRIADLLLSMDGETREHIGEMIARSISLQRQQNRPRPVSSRGDVRLTACVSQKGSLHLKLADARDHAIAVMTLQAEQDRALIWLQYSEHGLLEDVKWAFLTTADASRVDAQVLSKWVKRLRESRKGLASDDMVKPTP